LPIGFDTLEMRYALDELRKTVGRTDVAGPRLPPFSTVSPPAYASLDRKAGRCAPLCAGTGRSVARGVPRRLPPLPDSGLGIGLPRDAVRRVGRIRRTTRQPA